jgi:hypothetical protein
MLQEVDEALNAAAHAQPAWAGRVARKRLQIVGNIPQQMIHAQAELLAAINRPNASDAEKAASELLPLADACRFAAKVGRQVLAPQHFSFLRGAWWMGAQHCLYSARTLGKRVDSGPLQLSAVSARGASGAGASCGEMPSW